MINPGRAQIPVTPWASSPHSSSGPEQPHDRLPTPAHIEGFVRAIDAISFRYKPSGEDDDYRGASTRVLSPREQEHERLVRASAQVVAGLPAKDNVIYTKWSRLDGNALALTVVLPSTRLDGYGRPVIPSVTLFMHPGSDQDIAPANEELREQPGCMFGLLARTLGEQTFSTQTREDYAGPIHAVDPEQAIGITELYNPQFTYDVTPLP